MCRVWLGEFVITCSTRAQRVNGAYVAKQSRVAEQAYFRYQSQTPRGRDIEL